MIQVPDTEKCHVIAALVLFTTRPTDRALKGWNASDWTACDLADVRTWVRDEAARGAV